LWKAGFRNRADMRKKDMSAVFGDAVAKKIKEQLDDSASDEMRKLKRLEQKE